MNLTPLPIQDMMKYIMNYEGQVIGVTNYKSDVSSLASVKYITGFTIDIVRLVSVVYL